jgi:hypothetical protein
MVIVAVTRFIAFTTVPLVIPVPLSLVPTLILLKSETAEIIGEPLVEFPVIVANVCSCRSLLKAQKPLLLAVPLRYTPVELLKENQDPPAPVPVIVMGPVKLKAAHPSVSIPKTETPAE